MNPYFKLAGLLLLLGLSTITALEPALAQRDSGGDALHITIIYDNYQFDQKLKTDWGFACLLEYQGHQLLYDAGNDATLYRQNMEKLQIDPAGIPTLFISHVHGDHTAGVPWILQENPAVKCYLPRPYAEQLEAEGKLPKNSQTVQDAVKLHGPFYSTGDDFAGFREQGLVVKTENGGVLITGCGHPGAVAMVSRAQDELGIKIHTVIGGLHLLSTPGEEITQIADRLKQMGIMQICPTHCTGDQSIALLKETFGEGYIPGGAGKEIIIQ